MARKKAESEDSKKGIYSKFKSAEELLKEQESSINFIPVGPVIDDALGGGVPSGSLVSIRTKEKSGKTCLCMNIARNALLQGRRVFFYDIENRVNANKYFSISNFNVKDPNFFYRHSTKKDILKAEDVLMEQINLMQLEENRNALFIIDSLSKLVSSEVIDASKISGQRRSDIAKIQTDWLSKAGNLIRVSNCIVIVIQHLMASQNMFDPIKAKGSDGVNYESDICFLSYDKPKSLDGKSKFEEKNPKGLSMKLTVPYNKIKGPVNTAEGITTFLKFGEGVYFAREMAEMLQEYYVENDKGELVPMLKKNSGWYQFTCGDINENVQGINSVIDLIEENIDYFKNMHLENMKKIYNANYNLE